MLLGYFGDSIFSTSVPDLLEQCFYHDYKMVMSQFLIYKTVSNSGAFFFFMTNMMSDKGHQDLVFVLQYKITIHKHLSESSLKPHAFY